MAGVGSNVVLEDDKIKVWEFNLEPGEQTPVHTHELEYIFYVINGTTLEVFDADGKPLQPLILSDGDVVALEALFAEARAAAESAGIPKRR